MRLAARPRITAGVTVVSAAVIVATPVATPHLPHVSAPAIHLTAGSDTLADWQTTLGTAQADATVLWDHFSAAPFPALQQSVANGVGYLQDLIKNPSSIGTVITDIHDRLTAVANAPITPFLPVGDLPGTVYQSVDNIVNSTGTGALDGVPIDHQYLFAFVHDMIPSFLANTNIAPAAQSFLEFAGSPASGILMGEVGTMLSPALEFSADATAIADALSGSTPNLPVAFQDLLNLPADVTNAFLNGYGDVSVLSLLHDLGITSLSLAGNTAYFTALNVDLGGLLSPGGSLFDSLGIGAAVGALGSFDLPGVAVGPIASMVELGQAIAEALGWSGAGMPLDTLASLF